MSTPAKSITTPIVSVVIVSWNAKDYLAQCLTSLAAGVCNYPMEIIVVDNASNDGSPDMVAKQFPNVRLIRNSANLGFAKANNFGLREARGKYIALVNSDVKVLANCLTKLVDFCDAHPDAGMVGPRVQNGDGSLQRSCRGFPSVGNMFCRAFALDVMFPKARIFGGYLMPHWAHDKVKTVDILSGCFWVARAQALKKVGLLDESFFMYGEDMDWCKRFWKGGWKLYFVPDAEAIHYGGASSANSPVRFFIEKQRADLQYWKKHHSWPAQQAYFWISCGHHSLRAVCYAGVQLVRRSGANEKGFKVNRGLKCLKWMLTPSTVSAVVRPALAPERFVYAG